MIETFQLLPGLGWLTAAVFGLMVGSFLNVVMYRLPVMLGRDWDAQLEEWQAEREGTTEAEPEHDLATTAEVLIQTATAETLAEANAAAEAFFEANPQPRSEERRVGIECRSRWSLYH